MTDARATMALWRKHRAEWEKSQRPMIKNKGKSKAKADQSLSDEEEEGLEIKPKAQSRKRRIEELEEHPGAGVKGYSSGLSTIIKRRNSSGSKVGTKKADWWSTYEPEPASLTESRATGSKGSIQLHLSR